MPSGNPGQPRLNRRKQFCPKGHDTFVTGRDKSGKCTVCRKEKDSIRKKKYYREHIDLMKRKNKISHEKTKEQDKKRAKQWRKDNPDKVSFTNRKSRIKKKYGLTLEQIDLILIAQNNRCAICDVYFPGLKYSPHIDHDHETGKIRGLLCGPCNTSLGLLKEKVALFERAISYLKINSKNTP